MKTSQFSAPDVVAKKYIVILRVLYVACMYTVMYNTCTGSKSTEITNHGLTKNLTGALPSNW